MGNWWEQDWPSLGPVPSDLSAVSADYQAVMDAWGSQEPKARKGDDNGAIGTRILQYQAGNTDDLGTAAQLQQDLAEFSEAVAMFLDPQNLKVKFAAGTELPGFSFGVLKATPLDTIAGAVGAGFADEIVTICNDAHEHWLAGGSPTNFVYSYAQDPMCETRVNMVIESGLPTATANGFTLPAKIIGVDITIDKGALAHRNQALLRMRLKKEGDRIEYWRGGGNVLVLDLGDTTDPAWLAIQRDGGAKKGRIKLGKAHLYAGDEQGAAAVRQLIAGLPGFTAADGYKLDDGTNGVKPE